MSGKENIIAKIIGDAEAERQTVLADAQSKVLAMQAETERLNAELDRKTAEDLKKSGEEILSRRISVAELDVRKQMLAAKQEKLSAIFETAKQRILALPKADYVAFLVAMLSTYAEDGETVVVGKNDPVTKHDVLLFAQGKNLMLDFRADGEFAGGLILEGKKSDKNLTLDILLKEYREKQESHIAELLFGAEK